MKVAELFALITLKGGKESVATLKSMVSATVAVKSQLIGATTALYQMSAAARQSALFMDSYQLNTGLSAIQLQKLSFQASQAGLSMTELGGAIQKLQQANAQARLGYGWDPIFTRLGLTPRQDPVTQLNQIGSALRRLQATNPAEAKYLATKAGLSDSVYYAMLRGGTEQMDKQLILTQKEQQALVKLNQQWNKFWFYLKQIVIKIQALGASFQTGLIAILTRAAQGFYELFSRIYKTIEASDKLKYTLLAVGAILAAVFAPELLILSAVALALEDVFTYFEGGDSITGEIVEWCKQSQEFQDIWLGVKTVFDLLLTAFKGLKMLWDEFMSPALEKIDSLPFLKELTKLLNPVTFGLENIGKARRWWDEYMNNNLTTPGISNNSNVQNNNTNVYIQGTGSVAQDTDNAMEARRAVQQANSQQPNLSTGGKNGGYRYAHP